MYEKYFSLVEKPFNYLIPDPRFFYYSPQAQAIKRQCDYIVGEKSGHIFISGPIGAGKTTLLKTLTQNLLTDKKNVVNFINAPNLKTSNALMRRISEGFEVKTERSYNATLKNFTDWLKKSDRFPILVLDEGQNLVRDSLRTLHYLMTYVTNRLLMMIILCGQPDMVTKIERFPAIRSRMFPASLSALERNEADEMMAYRWRVASQKKANSLPFTKEAIDAIYKFSTGVPRAICQTADVALLAAFNTKKKKIEEALIKPVIRSLQTKKNG